ncbi:phosphatidylethanolamine-binding protein [Podospora fimiseda]|uniref:Large ribosomal subunit protein mL38 n=1 Tax=Podospora fimiseda TaxID=252190 RepID=A0AAN7H6J3_9PEZI|nr:phosphatidylethanolamine-binding protein [Podospora fimiseda]
MSTQQVARPIVRSLRQATNNSSLICQSLSLPIRQFSSTSRRSDEPTTTNNVDSEAAKLAADAALLGQKPKLASETTVVAQGSEQELAKFLAPGLGSRRRRAAMATTGNIPFELLPYQCFQEARKVLAQDREEKIAKIVAETNRIKQIEATDPKVYRGGEEYKQKRLESLRKHVEELKIMADINDPSVKRRFEDGMGDMTKPIYRYLAERKWRSMDYKIITQRINQFHIVPDLLPKFDPTMDVKLVFRGSKISPGEILPSLTTEAPPTLRMQVFDKGERLFSIVVLDSDVPDPKKDTFQRRLHFMATNIPWDPSKNSLNLARVNTSKDSSLAVPWLPPFAQSGSPYHRLSIFVLQHKDNKPLDLAELKKLYNDKGRERFSVKSFRDKFDVEPVGFTLFRSVWDEHTAAVMERHNIPGADIQFKQQRVYSLKPPRKARGWEAKRQGAKYKHLWKYTKRIKGFKY